MSIDIFRYICISTNNFIINENHSGSEIILGSFSQKNSIFLKRWGFARALYAYCLMKLDYNLGIKFVVVRAKKIIDSEVSSFESDGYVFRKIMPDELMTVATNNGLDLSREFVEKSLRRMDECVGALKNNELVGYTWRTKLSTQISKGIWVKFHERTCYHYKNFVHPAHRGKKLLRNMHLISEKSFISEGKNKCVSYIASHNYSSLKSSYASGERTVGYIVYIKLSYLFASWHSRGAKRFGFYIYQNKE